MAKQGKISSKVLVSFFLLVTLAFVLIAAIVWKLDQPLPVDTSPKMFNKQLYSRSDPDSLWVVVNKTRVLPADYSPGDLAVPGVSLRSNASDPQMSLRRPAAKALERMFGAATKDGIELRLASGFRSYNLQQAAYESEVNALGRTKADTESARAGYSEHQSGLAADIEPSDRRCEFMPCFAETAEGKWLARNSYKYGYVIRYLPGKQKITGYIHEPWHFRYVGTELANELFRTGLTLEQFFGLPPAADYSSRPLHLGGEQ